MGEKSNNKIRASQISTLPYHAHHIQRYLLSSTLQRQYTENSKQIFPEMKLRGLSPNFYIPISVSNLYIPMIGLPILLQKNRQNRIYLFIIRLFDLTTGVKNTAQCTLHILQFLIIGRRLAVKKYKYKYATVTGRFHFFISS
jgi:hypothetical protein